MKFPVQTLHKNGTFSISSFTIKGPQDQEIGDFYVVQERRATDFKAPKCERARRVDFLFLFKVIEMPP